MKQRKTWGWKREGDKEGKKKEMPVDLGSVVWEETLIPEAARLPGSFALRTLSVL